MIKRQYFTYRPLSLNYTYTPTYSFNNELNTIDNLTYKFVCDKPNDNRKLAYYEYEDTDTFIPDIVYETLLKYSIHNKTLNSAKIFIEEAFWEQLESLEIIWDKIIFKLKDIEILENN